MGCMVGTASPAGRRVSPCNRWWACGSPHPPTLAPAVPLCQLRHLQLPHRGAKLGVRHRVLRGGGVVGGKWGGGGCSTVQYRAGQHKKRNTDLPQPTTTTTLLPTQPARSTHRQAQLLPAQLLVLLGLHPGGPQLMPQVTVLGFQGRDGRLGPSRDHHPGAVGRGGCTQGRPRVVHKGDVVPHGVSGPGGGVGPVPAAAAAVPAVGGLVRAHEGSGMRVTYPEGVRCALPQPKPERT
jgi:hypothetical protein